MGQILRHFLGLDLGQAQDYSALAILERPLVPRGAPARTRHPAYALRHLHRFPLGTPYPAVVREVLALLRSPTLTDAHLVVDQTGVGRAVVDLFAQGLRQQGEPGFFPITITAGHAPTFSEDNTIHVPKKELVGAVQVLLQTRRLQIARCLPESDLLVRELQNFKVKVTSTAHEQFGVWREGQHDDLVLALALAAWVGELLLRPMPGDDVEDEDEVLHTVLVT